MLYRKTKYFAAAYNGNKMKDGGKAMLSGSYLETRRCADDTCFAEGNYMNRELVRAVSECRAGCEHMAVYIMREPDYRARIKQASLLSDCAEVCSLTAKCAARGSVYARQIASLCEDICEDCGAECARFNDAMSRDCASICACCAQECEKFTAAV